jgi:ubiquinone/menaquinone biosynthesis C-methylase UbiE
METTQFDTSRAEVFADRLLDILNGGATALMISVGHRTGLFDTMSELPPATSHDIAAAARLSERYVREWLGAMVVSGVVECDPTGTLFTLPAEHAACVTRGAGADNMAVFAQYIPLLGSVEDRIVECFENGGGVHYHEYGRFHEVMAEDSGQSVLPALIDSILPLAPGVSEAMERGIDVLDVGCGRGHALNLLAREFPNSRFVGYDLCEDALQAARAEAERNDLSNVRFEQRDMTTFDESDRYDLITAFDAIHDQKVPDHVLAAIARALRPEGTFLMQDIAGSRHVHKNVDHPIGPLLYTVSCMHCMSVSLAQEGAGLGAMWGEETAVEMLGEAGFGSVEKKNLPHDIQNNYYVVRIN